MAAVSLKDLWGHILIPGSFLGLEVGDADRLRSELSRGQSDSQALPTRRRRMGS